MYVIPYKCNQSFHYTMRTTIIFTTSCTQSTRALVFVIRVDVGSLSNFLNTCIFLIKQMAIVQNKESFKRVYTQAFLPQLVVRLRWYNGILEYTTFDFPKKGLTLIPSKLITQLLHIQLMEE